MNAIGVINIPAFTKKDILLNIAKVERKIIPFDLCLAITSPYKNIKGIQPLTLESLHFLQIKIISQCRFDTEQAVWARISLYPFLLAYASL